MGGCLLLFVILLEVVANPRLVSWCSFPIPFLPSSFSGPLHLLKVGTQQQVKGVMEQRRLSARGRFGAGGACGGK